MHYMNRREELPKFSNKCKNERIEAMITDNENDEEYGQYRLFILLLTLPPHV